MLFPCKAVGQGKCRSALCGAADLIVKISSESSGGKGLICDSALAFYKLEVDVYVF